MSEVEAAVATDQPAEQQSTNYSSFLGTDPNDFDPAAEPSPEPEAEGEVEELESEAETEEAVEEEPTEESEPTEEPSMDEFLSSLSPEERARYAKRYPNAWKLGSDPNQPEDVRQLLRDKINTDHEYQTLREAQQVTEDLDEPTVEEVSEEPPTQTQVLTPVQQKEAYQANVKAFVQQNLDPQSIKDLGLQMMGAFGVDITSKDPEVQAILANAPKVGETLATYLVDGSNTILPALLPGVIDAVFPGFRDMYDAALYARQWDSVRNAAGADGKPLYGELPDYGTREFKSALTKAAKAIPGFDRMVFTDERTGRPLPVAQQAQMKYQMLAKAASGQRVNPVVVAKAVETGKQIAAKQQKSVAVGRAMGSGKSIQRPQGAGQDDGMSDLDSWIASANSDMSPFSK